MIKREQAIELEECLADANDALERAGRIIAGFAKEDRIRFDGLLSNVLDALHGELSTAIYAEHPDMEPQRADDEEPIIDSELRWDQVRLPPSVLDADIDAVIFALMSTHWRKVAAVVGRGYDRCKELGIAVSYEVIAARLMALSDADRIEGIGDLRKWRYSEVRLKD